MPPPLSHIIRKRALELARQHVGVRETAPNRGPEIDRWLDMIDIRPGQPWCLAFVLSAGLIPAWRELAPVIHGPMSVFPLPLTGKVARFWRRTPEERRRSEPVPGAVFCHLKDPSKPESPGHCGLVVDEVDGKLITVEGNTNVAGERDGDGVMLRSRPLDYVNAGYVLL